MGPMTTRRQISETKFLVIEGQKPRTMEQVEEHEWHGYLRSVLYLIVTLCLVFVYGNYVQKVLPADLHALAASCKTYVHCSQQPICYAKAIFGGSKSCYSHGLLDTP